ncbi:MAG: hypothetical protein R3D45_04860 [Rhizobiaceae bacterium]
MTSPAAAEEVAVAVTDRPVGGIVTTLDGVFARTGTKTFRLVACAEASICLKPDKITGEAPKPLDGLPDGRIAIAPVGDIRHAWYGRPTSRYDHGVLGDAIEAGSLIAETADGRRHEFVLDPSYVFEDLTPRLADLDGDGRNEIVAIRTSLDRGAAIAVYGVVGGALVERAATDEIGRSHRWLNIAGIADYTGSGRLAIAWVETPHIGGILRMGEFANGKIQVLPRRYEGFSNHFIGSRELNLSVTDDFDGDGVADLALPSANRRALVIVAGGEARTIALPGQVGYALALVGGRIVTADTAGRLIIVHP